MSMQTTHLDVQSLAIVLGVVVPFLTALVVKEKAPGWLKAAANALLAAVAGAVTTAIGDGGNVILGQWVMGIFGAFVASVGSYFGLWKPTGATDAVSRKTATFGIGPVTFPGPLSDQAGDEN
jgi:hypothetical protein